MRQMNVSKFLLGGIAAGVFLFSGCSETNSEKNSVDSNHVGYFVNVFYDSIEYSCGNKREELGENGKFSCASFPVTFHANSVVLGKVDTIHGDGYVFPQDIISIDRTQYLEKSKVIRIATRWRGIS